MTWDTGKWGTTIAGRRYGATPNYAAHWLQRDGGHRDTLNGLQPSVKHQVTPNISTQMIINNVMGSMPPRDTIWVAGRTITKFNYKLSAASSGWTSRSIFLANAPTDVVSGGRQMPGCFFAWARDYRNMRIRSAVALHSKLRCFCTQ